MRPDYYYFFLPKNRFTLSLSIARHILCRAWFLPPPAHHGHGRPWCAGGDGGGEEAREDNRYGWDQVKRSIVQIRFYDWITSSPDCYDSFPLVSGLCVFLFSCYIRWPSAQLIAHYRASVLSFSRWGEEFGNGIILLLPDIAASRRSKKHPCFL